MQRLVSEGGAIMTTGTLTRPQEINDILARLHNVKAVGTDQWQADCPCAGHATPAKHLHIVNTPGKALIKCHPGQHSYADICRAIGFDTLTYLSGISQPAKQIVRTHNYKDVNGNLLYQVIRYEPKEFKYRRPDGKGGWIWNMNGIEPVLYHLDELIVSKLYTEMVYVCEGERDADNAFIYFGSTGTCNPFGAGKWRESYSEILTGCDVTIIPDNDEAGRQHALLVFTNLKNRAKSITIFKVPPQYKDFTEYLDGEDLLDV